jgi:serine/threonine protein phosphatase 1
VSGRTLAIGDIHGCQIALDTLLTQIQIEPHDTVVLMGDVIDRGPGTRNVIERLRALQQQCTLKLIRGNHEQMLFGVLNGSEDIVKWLVLFGGQEMIDSYGESLDDVPREHLDFLDSSIDYYETATEVFVHANLEPGIPLSKQSDVWLRWTRYTGRELPLPTGQRVICGHTSQRSGLPNCSSGWACIDTYVYGTGWLTCLDVLTDEFFQADQTGRYRTGQL